MDSRNFLKRRMFVSFSTQLVSKFQDEATLETCIDTLIDIGIDTDKFVDILFSYANREKKSLTSMNWLVALYEYILEEADKDIRKYFNIDICEYVRVFIYYGFIYYSVYFEYDGDKTQEIFQKIAEKINNKEVNIDKLSNECKYLFKELDIYRWAEELNS